MAEKVTFNQCYWPDVRDEVRSVNPRLADIIDDIDPGKDYPLFKGSYPYGTEIIRQGRFYLPNDRGEMVPLTDPSIKQEMKDMLGYNYFSNPACLCLKNTVEIFLPLEDRTVAFSPPIPAGKFFSTWLILNYNESNNHPAFLWSMSAGAKSIFMLPKISDAAFHKRLKKDFGISADKPKSLRDHSEVFRELAKHPQLHQGWSSELLYFSFNWFKSLKDARWRELHHYLLQESWEKSEFFRNKFIWDLIFSLIKEQKKIKVSAYIDNCVKHMLGIAAGGYAGFMPAEAEDVGPIQSIKKAYVESYRLTYPPIIMRPAIFNISDGCPVYYSLQVPTAQEFSLKPSKDSTTIGDLYEVKSLLFKYRDAILEDKFHVEHTPYYRAVREVNIDFFHSQPESYTGISNVSDIPKIDERFLDGDASAIFPSKATFLQGCMRAMGKSN